MRTLFAFFANAAEIMPGGRFSVLGADYDAIEGILPLSVPQMVLLFKLEAEPGECGREHGLMLQVTGPEGNNVEEPMVQVITPPVPDQEGQQVVMTIIMTIHHITFHAPGRYTWRLTVDNEEAKTLFLNVTRREAPNAGTP